MNGWVLIFGVGQIPCLWSRTGIVHLHINSYAYEKSTDY